MFCFGWSASASAYHIVLSAIICCQGRGSLADISSRASSVPSNWDGGWSAALAMVWTWRCLQTLQLHATMGGVFRRCQHGSARCTNVGDSDRSYSKSRDDNGWSYVVVRDRVLDKGVCIHAPVDIWCSQKGACSMVAAAPLCVHWDRGQALWAWKHGEDAGSEQACFQGFAKTEEALASAHAIIINIEPAHGAQVSATSMKIDEEHRIAQHSVFTNVFNVCHCFKAVLRTKAWNPEDGSRL